MLVIANQTRRELGLEDPQVYDTEIPIRVAIEAIRDLIAQDGNRQEKDSQDRTRQD